ncbi:MAG: hypothetical protein ACOH1I_12190 [Gallionellaceae bacterium]
MKLKRTILYAVLIASFFSNAAFAEAKNGFSLNAGTASHSRTCGVCTANSTSGLSLGMDYQFALSSNFSINPFLMTSSETVPNISGMSAGHGILGVQGRFWIGDIFMGAHLGSYSEVFTTSNSTASANGTGAGLVVGWEKPDGGLYVMGQFDSATVTPNTAGYADAKFTALRLSVGYRWK